MKKKLIYLSIVFFIVFIIPFITLKIGFNISSFESKKFSVQELYIKLDKRLIIRAKKINILEFGKNTSNESFAKVLLSYMKELENAFLFLQEFSVDNFKIANENFKIVFKRSEILLENEKLSLKLDVSKIDNNILAYIKEANITELNASLNAFLHIDTDKNLYDINGSLLSESIKLDFNTSFDDNNIFVNLKDVNASDIKDVFDLVSKNIELDEDLLLWLGKKAVPKNYYIDEFTLKMQRKLFKAFEIKELSGFGVANDLTLLLNDGVDEIFIPKLDLNLSKEKLDFYFEKAYFAGKDISKSKVYIYDIANPKKIGINIRLLSNDLSLDPKVHKLLNSYKISLPLSQKSGFIKSDFSINVPFQKHSKNDFKGVFELKNVQSTLADFFVKEGTVVLDNTNLKLKSFAVFNSFLNANFNSNINLASKSGTFNAYINRLHFDNLLDLRDENVSINLDFSNDLMLGIKEWDLDLNLSKGIEFYSKNILKFKKYSPIMQDLNVSKIGLLHLKSQDFNNFSVSLKDSVFTNDFIELNSSNTVKDNFYIEKSPKGMKIRNDKKNIELDLYDKNLSLQLKDINFVLKDVENLNSAFNNNLNINLNANNLGLILADFNKSLKFDKLFASVNGDLMRINASKNASSFDFYKGKNKLLLQAKNINDKIVNEFFSKDVVKDGKFSLNIEGSSTRDFNGSIVLEKTYIKGLTFQNQLISFIDTVPSLVLFKTPTFNKEGLGIQKGLVLFDKKNTDINITSLALDGDSVDVLGFGAIDLKKDRLRVELELKILKSASQIISKIPILNQVILGKDMSISTAILVEGSLQEPKFSTQIFKETIKLPFNLIKNIIEIPSTWFK